MLRQTYRIESVYLYRDSSYRVCEISPLVPDGHKVPDDEEFERLAEKWTSGEFDLRTIDLRTTVPLTPGDLINIIIEPIEDDPDAEKAVDFRA